MALLQVSAFARPFPQSPIQTPLFISSSGRKISPSTATRNFRVVSNCLLSTLDGAFVLHGSVVNFSRRFCGLKLWILQKLKFQNPIKKHGWEKKSKRLEIQGKDQYPDDLEMPLLSEEKVPEEVFTTRLQKGLYRFQITNSYERIMVIF